MPDDGEVVGSRSGAHAGMGLLETELLVKFLLRVREDLHAAEIRAVAERAIDTFWRAYRPE